MKIKFKLSLLVIAIMAVVIAGISVLLLLKASDPDINLSVREVRCLTVLNPTGFDSMDIRRLTGIGPCQDTFWTVLVGSEETYIISEAQAISKFPLVMAAIAITVAAFILFIVLGFAISPIMAFEAEQANAAINRVDKTSLKNKENIDLRVEEVAYFKVE